MPATRKPSTKSTTPTRKAAAASSQKATGKARSQPKAITATKTASGPKKSAPRKAVVKSAPAPTRAVSAELAVAGGVPSQGHAPAVESIPASSPVVAAPQPAVLATRPLPLVLPQTPSIKSKSYAAPLSYIGSARRIGAGITKLANGNSGAAAALWVPGIFALALAWSFVTFWYLIIFGLFGVFTFPFRLMRRSQRKSQHIQQVSLATQQAMLLQQQQLMSGHQSAGPQ